MAAKFKNPVLTVKRLVKWLETQPRATRYNYVDSGDCLIARFVADQGFAAIVSPSYVSFEGGDIPLPRAMDEISERGVWTYSAALRRARQFLASR